MSRQVKQIASLAFANRRNRKGKVGRIKHRCMKRSELEKLLGMAWDGALEDAAQIVRGHEDDDDRPMAAAILAIADEIQGVA